MDLLLANIDPNIDSDPFLPAILDSDLIHSFNDPIPFLSPIFDFDANQFYYNDSVALNSNSSETEPGCLLNEPVSNSELLAPHSLKSGENYDCLTFDLNKFNESLLAPSPSQYPSLTTLMEIPEDQFYKFDLANPIDLLLTSLPNPQSPALSLLPLQSAPPVLNTLENLNHESHASLSESLSSLSSLSPASSSSSFSSSSISSDSNLSPLPSSPEVAKRNVKKRKRETLDETETDAAAAVSSSLDKAKQLRKREQNRQASIRYRQKKKTEFENMMQEEKQLSQDVQQLQSKIDKMKMWVECFENLYQEMSSSTSSN